MRITAPIFFILIMAFVPALGCSQQLQPQAIPLDLSGIALINEVWYKNNQQYIHPSFTYAGTGFLIRSEQGVLAATAKHVLLIAKPEGMKGVSPNAHLERWIMHPKQSTADSVVIGQLLNEDTNEVLGFNDPSIQLRDWIVFTTKYHSPNIKALTPRFRPLEKGEIIYFTGCPYKDENYIIGKARVLSVKGNRIVFSKENQAANVGGISGSPLIDAEGKLVGIFSGTSVNPEDGADAFFGISTHYLEKILTGEKDLNKSVTPIADFLNRSIVKVGVPQTIQQYHQLNKQSDFYFDYQVSPEGINQVAESLLENGQAVDALKILDLSLAENAFFSSTHTLIGKAHLANKELRLARNAIAEALRLWPGNEAAQQILQALDGMK